MNKRVGLCFLFLLLIISGCKTTTTTTEEVLPIVEQEKPANELLSDSSFSRGFYVTAFDANSSGGEPVGTMDYLGNRVQKDPLWRLAQWGCEYSLMDAEVTQTGNVYTYQDESKTVKINPITGSISLEIDGKAEYGDTDRANGEPWPHLLLEQTQVSGDFIKNYEKLYMEIDFTLTKMENKQNGPVNPNLHAAQFQWFITLSNQNPNSPDYGRGMWFGLGFYDSRHDSSFVPGYAAPDGGKEDNTGMYIYIVDSRRYLKSPVVLNQEVDVKVDIIPHIKQALQMAKMNNFLKNTTFEDLKIGSTNVGWELPGTYDVGVDIQTLKISHN